MRTFLSQKEEFYSTSVFCLRKESFIKGVHFGHTVGGPPNEMLSVVVTKKATNTRRGNIKIAFNWDKCAMVSSTKFVYSYVI